MQRVRRHGLQSPLSPYQVVTAGGHVVASATYAALMLAADVTSDQRALAVGVFALLFVGVMACWLYLELVDPSEKRGGIPYPCMRFTSTQTRYCATCRKQVPGLDHHCVWLNTCIGKRNYVVFITLTCAGTLQYCFMSLACALLATSWRSDDTATVVLAMLQGLASVGICISFSVLLFFHFHLMYLGVGTYDWLLGLRPAKPDAQQAQGGKASSAARAPAASAQEQQQRQAERAAQLEAERKRWTDKYGPDAASSSAVVPVTVAPTTEALAPKPPAMDTSSASPSTTATASTPTTNGSLSEPQPRSIELTVLHTPSSNAALAEAHPTPAGDGRELSSSINDTAGTDTSEGAADPHAVQAGVGGGVGGDETQVLGDHEHAQVIDTDSMAGAQPDTDANSSAPTIAGRGEASSPAAEHDAAPTVAEAMDAGAAGEARTGEQASDRHDSAAGTLEDMDGESPARTRSPDDESPLAS